MDNFIFLLLITVIGLVGLLNAAVLYMVVRAIRDLMYAPPPVKAEELKRIDEEEV